MSNNNYQLPIINGDLITANVDMIAQQCNSVTVKSHGLSMYIKDNLNVDPYGQRQKEGYRRNLAIKSDRSTVGTVTVYETQLTKPKFVACLFAQFSPGKPKAYYIDVAVQHTDPVTGKTIDDSALNRQSWFKRSLDELAKEMVKLGCTTVAFPYLIGCGLAGGHWPTYQKMITEWSYQNKDNFTVSFIRKQ